MLVSGAGGGRRTRPERLLDQVNILAVTRTTVIRILRLFLVDLRSHRDFPEPRSERLFFEQSYLRDFNRVIDAAVSS